MRKTYNEFDSRGGYIYLLEVIEPLSSFFGYKYIGKHNGKNKYYFSGSTLAKSIINKYGIDSIKKTIIVKNITNEVLLNELEKHYIRLYNTFYLTSKLGFNYTIGGEGVSGRKMDKEHLDKLIKIHTNKIVSNETRLKLSKAAKGRKMSEQFKLHLSKVLTGKKRTKEQREKMKISNSGKTKGIKQSRDICLRKSKKVLKFDLQNNFIMEYESLKIAALDNGLKNPTCITACIKGITSNAAGYKWKYKNE